MANSLPETSVWEDCIYQLEPTERVIVGSNGIANRQATQLANLTQYLKDSVKALAATATTSENGLMSSGDKSKLDGIFSGKEIYPHPYPMIISHTVEIRLIFFSSLTFYNSHIS